MYEAILIVVDAGPNSPHAVAEGVALARIHGAEVVFNTVLQRVVEPVLDMPMAGTLSAIDFEIAARLDADRLLSAAEAVARQAGVPSRRVVSTGTDDAECICEAARETGCKVIVIASTGRNAVVRLLGGSVIPRLITRSTLPVLIVREPVAGDPHPASPADEARSRLPLARPDEGGGDPRAGRPVLWQPVP